MDLGCDQDDTWFIPESSVESEEPVRSTLCNDAFAFITLYKMSTSGCLDTVSASGHAGMRRGSIL